MKYALMNLGCKVNAYEAESVASVLDGKGYERTEFSDETADVYLIFTCAVTNTAAQKSRQMIHRARRKNRNALLAVAGCYSQVDPDSLNDVDILIGTANKGKLPEYIETCLKTGETIRDIHVTDGLPFEILSMDRFTRQTRAYLKIQDGCNQFCSFCVIPFARGRERSMAPDRVIAEAERISRYHKEIVLTGIHTGRYGKEYHVTLAQLIRRILNECAGLERLRISSIEITEIDEDLITLLKDEPRVARHLHIPLQSGCDSVLDRMGRPYHTQEYYDKISYIRSRIPEISISTDLIVGFPQETEEEFDTTVSFLKHCAFSFLHVFPYSERAGTRAVSMPGHLSGIVKKKRAAICTELSEELYDAYKTSMIGKTVDVLFETDRDGVSFGHSSEYLPVMMLEKAEPNTIYQVTLTKLADHRLYGERKNRI